MPNSVTRRRTPVALLAVFAMVASVFVFPLAAQGHSGEPEVLPDWSACVAAATADAGFGDTSGNFAEADIDCIYHYGITTGTSASTYSPGDMVTRWQMALFLTRAAGPTGLGLPVASDQGFLDIGGLAQGTQDAINQIAALNISKGTSATTFDPNGYVTRQQMALFLTRFLDASAHYFGPDCDTGSHASGFGDTGSVSFEAYNAIEAAFDCGITTGTTATTFSPNDYVTRDQMAAFIARTLAHTNAAPAGVSIQAVPTAGLEGANVDFKISVRDGSHNPVPFALVDGFYVFDPANTSPLKSDGTCDGDAISWSSVPVCEIDLNDFEMDSHGNWEDSSSLPSEASKGETIWVFTGDQGDKFDADTTQFDSVTLQGSAPIDYGWKVTITDDDGPFDPNSDQWALHFGETVTWTFQLIDLADNNANVAEAGVDVTITYDTETYVDFNSAPNDGLIAETYGNTAKVTTDSSGKAVFSVTKSDPDAGAAEAADRTDWEIIYVDYIDFEKGSDLNPDDYYNWTDEAPEVASETLSASSTIVDNSTTAGSVTITYTALDQYGDGVGGMEGYIHAHEGNSSELLFDESPTLVTSGSTGKASYTFKVKAAGAVGGIGWNAHGDFDSHDPDYVWVYFSAHAADDSGPTCDAIAEASTGEKWDDGGGGLLYNTDANLILISDGADGGQYWYTYDANDSFRVDGSAVSMADFEAALKTHTHVTVQPYDDTSGNVSGFNLTNSCA